MRKVLTVALLAAGVAASAAVVTAPAVGVVLWAATGSPMP